MVPAFRAAQQLAQALLQSKSALPVSVQLPRVAAHRWDVVANESVQSELLALRTDALKTTCASYEMSLFINKTRLFTCKCKCAADCIHQYISRIDSNSVCRSQLLYEILEMRNMQTC